MTCLDRNNLCGWGLGEYLLYGGFKWLENVNGYDVNSISEKIPIGYFFKVDLKYPELRKTCFRFRTLASEKLALSSDML